MWRKIKFILWTYWRIPRGSYCYRGARGTKTYKPCPYWEKLKDRSYQEDGYCHLLKRGDAERNNSDEIFTIQDFRTGETREERACEMPIGVGLLWDQLKECGIKSDDWWEIWEYQTPSMWPWSEED